MTKISREVLGGGSGRPLVMLHGWGHERSVLRPLAELLSHERPVILLDLPGFGLSPKPDGVWGTEDYARVIREELALPSCDLFGHSFGGKIALHYARQHPDEVGRVVLCNAAGFKKNRTLRSRSLGFLGKACKGIDRIVGTHLFSDLFAPRFGSADYRAAGEMRDILVRSVNEDLTKVAAGIETETLLLWGECDSDTPLEFGRRYRQLIAPSRLVVLEGKGHSPFLDAGHHLLASYMEPFLR